MRESTRSPAPGASVPGSYQVEVVDRDLRREGLADWWNGLPQARGTPMLRWEWLSTWAAAFLPPGARLQVHVALEAGRPVAALPLYRVGGRVYSLSNSQSDVFDAGFEPGRPESTAALIAAAARRRLRLTRLDGESRLLADLGARAGPMVLEPLEGAPYLDLPSSLDALLAARSRNFRSRARRAVRGLEALGQIGFEDLAATESTASQSLEAFIALEAAGWKGAAGTAIQCSPSTSRFYRELALDSPAGEWVRLSLLRANGRILAAHYGLEYNRRRYLLKTAYDERLTATKSYSPGLALMWYVLQDCIGRGLQSYEFTGVGETWKLDWTGTTRPRRTVLAWPRTPSGWIAREARVHGKPLLGPLARRLRQSSGAG